MRVLVATDDRVGPAMAGSALRAWELARVVRSAGHEVHLLAAAGSEPPGPDGPTPEEHGSWRDADAVVCPAWSLPPRAFLAGRRLRLVVDGTTPLLAELDAMPDGPAVRRRRRTAAARLPLVAQRADAVLVAGGAQEAWWRRVVRPGVPLLQVPFGVPDEPFPGDPAEVPGVPRGWRIVLWWGGVWPWLDLDSLLAARARLEAAKLSIVVPTGGRPGGGGAGLDTPGLRRRANRFGLDERQVVALEEWVPYVERHRLLAAASLLAVLHHPGAEAELAFRTRALDGMWATVPLLVSDGGEVARLVRTNRWGAAVPPKDIAAAAAAMELLLGDREQGRCREALEEARPMWRWTEVARPLVTALDELPVAPRGRRVVAAVRAGLRLLVGRRRS